MKSPNKGSDNKTPDLRKDLPKNSPQTLLQLLKLLIVGMITGFRKNIPFFIGLSLLAWLVHTYLLVVVNEGFYPSNPKATSMLALKGTTFSGTLFWTLLGMIGMNLLYKIRNRRLIRTIKNIGSSPRWVSQSHKQAGPIAIPIILGTGALGLYLGIRLNNPLVNLQLAFILLGGIIAQRESLLTLAVHLFWSDTHRLLKKPKGTFNLPGAVMGITGMTLGFTLAIYLAKSDFFGFLIIVLMLGVMAALILKQKGKLGSRALPVLIILVYSCIIIMLPAFADDGGWQESGGTLEQWLASEGALIAIYMGLQPALGMGLGSLLGAAAAQGAFIYGGLPGVEGGEQTGTEEGTKGEAGTKEKTEQDKSEKEKAEKEKAEKEKAEKEKAEKEKAQKEKAEKEKAEREKAQKEAQRREAIEKRKKELLKQMEESQREAARQNARADFFGNLVSIFSVVEKTADVGVDVLSTVTGPAGQTIKTAYTVTKDISKNMSESYSKGESMVDGAIKGAGEAIVDVSLDKFGGAVADKFGGKIPGFGKFESTVDYGKESVSGFTKMIKETAEEGSKNIARENIKEAGKNALQGQIQGESLWNPFKKFLGFS